jgi:hypothetical protein
MGNTLAHTNARSNTRKELLKQAEELGVVGRSRMNKADLADAIARKEAMRAAVEQELLSVEAQVRDRVWEAAQQEFRAAAQEVRREMRSLTQSARQSVQEAMRAAAEQEVQEAARAAAEQEVPAAEEQEAVPADAEDLAQATVQAGRAARGRASPGFQERLQHAWAGFRRVSARLRSPVLTVLIAVITSMATAILANDYYTSRIEDWAFRRGSLPISTEATLERANAQGLTWVFRGGLGLDDLSAHAQLLLGQAATSPSKFNQWIRGQGGVDVDASFIKLIVRGNRQAGVKLTGMQAKVEQRGPPLRGAFFYAPPEGERENAQVGFDLEEAIPVARLVEPNKTLGDPDYLGDEYFMNKSVDLALGEDQVFNVVALTTSYHFTWYIEMEVKAGGRTQYIRVDLRGAEKQPPFPFQVSARADSRDNKKGSFAVYKELYVLDRSADPAGFIPVDPQAYAP